MQIHLLRAQLASHGGAFTSPEVEGVGITKNGIYIYIYYISLYMTTVS